MTEKYFIHINEGGYAAGRYCDNDSYGVADTIMDAKKMCCERFNRSIKNILDDESSTCYYDSWSIDGNVRKVDACKCKSDVEAEEVFNAEVIEVDGWYIEYEEAMGLKSNYDYNSILELHFELNDYHNRGTHI